MKSRFPSSVFIITLLVLFLMSGIHVGLIVFMNKMQWGSLAQCIVPIVYWVAVAVGMTLLTRSQIRKTYEEPMQNLAKATEAVANGDFSVYMQPIHTPDKYDYLDQMILDFNKMVEELGSIETLKTDFVSNVSHEMKTPIAIIKNYAELIKSQDTTPEQRVKYADTIEDASVRLSNLISNILKLNKLENQRIAPELAAYDLSRQLTDCILQFEEVWEEKNIEIDVDIEDQAMIMGDASLLEMVWNNLLSNALKFTEPGGTISIKQTTEGDCMKIEIADTGCGMNKETARRIFDKFYQGDTSHSQAGNGLGLALVKRILEILDGDIHVISEEGKGSTFVVHLNTARKEETV